MIAIVLVIDKLGLATRIPATALTLALALHTLKHWFIFGHQGLVGSRFQLDASRCGVICVENFSDICV